MNIAKYPDGNWSVFPQGLDVEHIGEMEERGVRVLTLDVDGQAIDYCTAYEAGRHTADQKIYISEVRWVVDQAVNDTTGGAA